MRYVALGLAAAALSFSANTTNSAPTFYKDVLPVLQNNCQECHRPGEAAPMSFLTYESTRPWAKAIKAAVVTKKMPPWFADPNHGRFANDRTLADPAKQTLVSWADGGAPAGDPKDAPKPVQFTEGWGIPKPDVVFDMGLDFDIPASGTIDYQYIVIPTHFTEDRWIQFAEARPQDRERVHHIIAFIREPGNPWLKEAKPGVPFVPAEQIRREQQQRAERRERGNGAPMQGELLVGYAPGLPPTALKPGQARLLKAGSDIVLQMHYNANGKPGHDRSRIGIVFAKGLPEQRIMTLAAMDAGFAIPPGDPNYQVDAKVELQEDTKLVALLPHMHLRGKDFEYRAIYPTGEKEVLLRVPRYDFNWQLWYTLAQPKVIPAGTVIECTAHFDNSPNNPANPDPKKEIHFGEQSWEEMMIGFFDVAVSRDTNLMDLVQPKKDKAKTGD